MIPGEKVMHRRAIGLAALVLLLTACAGSTTLQAASEKYKTERDYHSLQVIYQHLEKGMPKAEVDRLLGKPDYSPTDGQYYYSSDKREYSDVQKRAIVVGLIVDYHNEDFEVTDKLQEYSLGPIGE